MACCLRHRDAYPHGHGIFQQTMLAPIKKRKKKIWLHHFHFQFHFLGAQSPTVVSPGTTLDPTQSFLLPCLFGWVPRLSCLLALSASLWQGRAGHERGERLGSSPPPAARSRAAGDSCHAGSTREGSPPNPGTHLGMCGGGGFFGAILHADMLMTQSAISLVPFPPRTL